MKISDSSRIKLNKNLTVCLKAYLSKYKMNLLVVIIFSLTFILSPQASDSAVELVYFRGGFSEEPTSVKLEWETSFESRTAGYFIKRKISGSEERATTISVLLNGSATNFIPAADDGTTGAEYTVSDTSITQGQTYEYSLWEQEFNSSEPTAPEKLLVIEAIPESVSTELEIATEVPNTPTPSATATNTATADPNATTTSTATPTATFPATSTPQNNITPSPTTANSDAENGGDDQPIPTTTQTVAPTEAAPETEESAPIITPTAAIEQATEIPTQASSGVAEASELPQEDTYPEPGEEPETEDAEYVPPPTNTPLPISEQNVQPIGEGIESPEVQPEFGGQAIEQVDAEEVSRNRLILWGGFLGSLLFFIAVVIGTILMYRQRNTSG